MKRLFIVVTILLTLVACTQGEESPPLFTATIDRSAMTEKPADWPTTSEISWSSAEFNLGLAKIAVKYGEGEDVTNVSVAEGYEFVCELAGEGKSQLKQCELRKK